MRAESISYIEPIRVKNRRICNLVSPKISIKNTALSIERYALYHSGRSSSSASSIGCPDPAALFCNATKVSFVIPENHTFSALPDFPDETRPAPQDILSSLLQARHHRPPFSSGYTGCIAGQGAVPHFDNLLVPWRRYKQHQNLPLFLQKSRITKKNPLVGCCFLIVKCQFPRCVFLFNCGRCREAGLKAIFRNCRDPHFLISPVSRQDSERQHGNPWPLINFCFTLLFCFMYSNLPFPDIFQIKKYFNYDLVYLFFIQTQSRNTIQKHKHNLRYPFQNAIPNYSRKNPSIPRRSLIRDLPVIDGFLFSTICSLAALFSRQTRQSL